MRTTAALTAAALSGTLLLHRRCVSLVSAAGHRVTKKFAGE